MTLPIDFTKLVSTTDFVGDDPEEEALIREMIGRAHAYLSAFEMV